MNIVRKMLRIYQENTMDTVWNTEDILILKNYWMRLSRV